MADIFVSIITPAYNSSKFVMKTIESVQKQTYTNWEMIIVDDCSEDDTCEIVARYAEKDKRIKLCRHESNLGTAAARNTAMKLAEGSYMAFLDADDIWMPDKLERQIAFMNENRYAITCTAYVKIDKNDRLIGRKSRTVKKINYNRLLLDCPVGNSTVLYNVEALGKFEVPDIRRRNDDALWLKILKKEEYIYMMPDVLMKYRVHQNSISKNKIKLIKYHWQLYRDIEHLSFFRSVFHVCWWCIIKLLGFK